MQSSKSHVSSRADEEDPVDGGLNVGVSKKERKKISSGKLRIPEIDMKMSENVGMDEDLGEENEGENGPGSQ